MAHDEHRLHADAYRPEGEIDDLFATANPNPERLGCPSAAALRELAGRKRPIDDPLYAHLTKCSPCYRQFRALQSVAPDRTRRLLVPLAAVLLVGVAGVVWQWRGDSAAPSPQELAWVEIDLRPFAATRSDSSGTDFAVRLKREQIVAEFILPVASEMGLYEVRLLDVNRQSKAASSGEAVRVGGQTRLRAELDLRNIDSSDYQLALRREGQEWQLYPVRVD
jgi:hypothetical protein